MSDFILKNRILDILPLLPFQKTILYSMLVHPESYQYYELWKYGFHGFFNYAKILEAWNITRTRYDVLRGVFKWEGLKEPLFIIYDSLPANSELYDLSEINEKERQSISEQIVQSEWKNRVKISDNPIRLAIIKMTDNYSEWVICSNHILFDGWSNSIIMESFFQTYTMLMQGSLCVSKNVIKYRDYYLFTKEEMEKKMHKNFWANYLTGYHPGTGGVIHKVSGLVKANYIITKELLSDLLQFTNSSGCSLSTILYAAWAILASMEEGSTDILIGVTVSGRKNFFKRRNGEIVGLLVRTVPLRINCEPQHRIIEIIKGIQMDMLSIEDHMYVEQDYLYELIPDIDNIYRKMLTIQNYPVNMNGAEDYSLEFLSSYYVSSAEIAASIKLFMKEKTLEVAYDADKYSKYEIDIKIEFLFQIIREIEKNMDGTISDILGNMNCFNTYKTGGNI